MMLKPLATVHRHPAPAAASEQHAEHLHDALWRAGNAQQGACNVMGQLHGLFAAIRKQGGAEALPLAQIGEGLTADWVDLLSDSAESALALCEARNAAAPMARPDSHQPPNAVPPAEAGAGLSMGAYDTATLHLEKAETLAEMLDTLGHGGLQRLGSTHLASAISCLIDELTAVRKALELGRPRGDA